MGKEQVPWLLKENMADGEGDHATWQMSPGKQRVWEHDEVRDIAEERR